MNLQLKRFQAEYFAEYAAWFLDEELNRRLGPMDDAWLKFVLAESAADGMTWAVFRNTEFVAVVEAIYDPQNVSKAVISAVATKPALRGQGIGSAVLELVLSLDKNKGITRHAAYISLENQAGRRCAEKVGFIAVSSKPNDHGFIEFQHDQ